MRFLLGLLLISFLSFRLPAQLTWVEQNSGVSIPLTSVWSIAGEPIGRGWICGYNGTVLRTTNAGANWISVGANGIPLTCQLQNISAVDDNTALTAGNIGTTTYVFRTTNGGTSWTQVFTQSGGQINGIWMSPNSPGKAFMVGNPVSGRWSLWRTPNSGTIWDSSGLYLPQSGGETGWSNSLVGSGAGNFWFGTTNSRIYYSSDTGHSWTAQASSPLTNVQALWVGGTGNGIAYGQGLINTTNFGSNWISAGTIGTGFYAGIAGYLSNQWLARGNTIYATTNLGNNWSVNYTAPSGNYKTISYIHTNGIYVWAIRDNGGISETFFEFLGIKKLSDYAPESFMLSQNYPNPFNPVTKIQFSVPTPLHPPFRQRGEGEAGGFVRLIIYDILGREISTLVNEGLAPGTYEVEWDGSDYPSGVYFYKLTVDDASAPLSITKRTVLLK